jgi:hypothetical protein
MLMGDEQNNARQGFLIKKTVAEGKVELLESGSSKHKRV